MSFFQDILTKTKSLLPGGMTRSHNSSVGIDIGTSAIKLVQVKKDQGKIVLETYGELSLATYAQEKEGKVVTLDPEVIATAIKDLLKESNVTTTSAVFSIQSQATLIFLLELPETSEADLVQIIPNEARKYIPVALTEVSLDWYIVPKKQNFSESDNEPITRPMMEVVVVAVRNETLAQYKQIAEKTNVTLQAQEVEVFSAIRSVFHREIAPTLVVDFGANTTKVSIIEYGVVRAYHVINRGSAFVSETLSRSLTIDFDEAEALKKTVGITSVFGKENIATIITTEIQYIINEIQTILLQYERQSHKAITKIILIGGGSLLPGFIEKISESFGVESVHGDPFSKTDHPEFMNPVLIKAGPEFTIATGLALKDFL